MRGQLIAFSTYKQKWQGYSQFTSPDGAPSPTGCTSVGWWALRLVKGEACAQQPSVQQSFRARELVLETEKGGDLGAQQTFSNETKEGLGAAVTMLPAAMGRVASAQSQ